MTVAAADARAAARLEGLHAAAARAERLLDWREAARPIEPLADIAATDAAPAKAPRGFRWPFGRKPDPQAGRQAAILAELEASVAGRPPASAKIRAKEPETLAPRERLRAAS